MTDMPESSDRLRHSRPVRVSEVPDLRVVPPPKEQPPWRLPAGLISDRDADDAEAPCTD
jgi:hypothetical protein